MLALDLPEIEEAGGHLGRTIVVGVTMSDQPGA